MAQLDCFWIWIFNFKGIQYTIIGILATPPEATPTNDEGLTR